jgi:dihydrofolate synthase / folylpolyglutamate synthase
MKTYPDSVRFLYSLGNEVKTIKLGLERIDALMEEFGHPERSYHVVHVAGTNGKGSTCAMIEAALRTAGHRTGLTISPHLLEPTERIQIDRRPVSEAEFTRAFERVHETALRMVDGGLLDAHPTYFETVTAMAFWLFRERGVEWAVVETGLGGRLDATNIVWPRLSVITPVDFDHESWLGSSIEQIAFEKAGILKPTIPAVFASMRANAETVLKERAHAIGAPFVRASDTVLTDLRTDAFGCRYSVTAPAIYEIECHLAGDHQVINSQTAVTALHQLGIPREALEQGIREARWAGRLDRIRTEPDIILDGAHNPAGVRALAHYINAHFQGRKVWLIYGTMRDKSVDEIGELLSPVASEIILTAADSPRALRPEALAPLFDHPHIRTARRLADALALTTEASPQDAIFITGSLLLVGEAYSLLA